MGNLELLDKIDFRKVDPKEMHKHIDNFPTMLRDAFILSESITIPPYYIKAKKVVLLGMGGSGQAGDIVKNLLLESTDLVVESVHNYTLPGFVDSDTLVVANSYSGNTEETLAAFISAHDKGAKLIAITTGGKLKILADKYKAPVFLFDYKCPPRASFPYLSVLLLSIFSKLGYIADFNGAKIDEIVTLLEKAQQKYRFDNSLMGNPAKNLAEKIFGKIPVVYASEKLFPVASRMKAQFNENSKNFAYAEEFPELNHKSLEGLLNPKGLIIVLMLESNFEQLRNQTRENITADVLHRNKVSVERVKMIDAKDRLSEIYLNVMFGDYVSYYLAVLNKANPGINDIVDYLKEKLA
jgi:glucose/mannose-6-phosphate isomerase